jgi:hypothetical protein
MTGSPTCSGGIGTEYAVGITDVTGHPGSGCTRSVHADGISELGCTGTDDI